jgi:hypothetical protein
LDRAAKQWWLGAVPAHAAVPSVLAVEEADAKLTP